MTAVVRARRRGLPTAGARCWWRVALRAIRWTRSRDVEKNSNCRLQWTATAAHQTTHNAIIGSLCYSIISTSDTLLTPVPAKQYWEKLFLLILSIISIECMWAKWGRERSSKHRNISTKNSLPYLKYLSVTRYISGAVAVRSWTCDQWVLGSIITRTRLHNYLGQVVHTYVPLSPTSITWYRSKDGEVLQLGKWPQACRKVMATYRRDDLKSYLRADCLYTGISSGSTLGMGVWYIEMHNKVTADRLHFENAYLWNTFTYRIHKNNLPCHVPWKHIINIRAIFQLKQQYHIYFG